MKAAPLSGNLLARKGEARPSLVQVSGETQSTPPSSQLGSAAGIATIMRPSLGRTVDVQSGAGKTNSAQLGGGGPYGGPPMPSDCARLTMRLDRDRHRKLKILAANRGQSVQQLLVAAVDGLVSQCVQQADGRQCACLNETRPPLQPVNTKPAAS